MYYPKITFHTDHGDFLECTALCFNAKSIANGSYTNGNYYVLPYPVFRNRKTVHFPDIKLSKDFWKAIINNPNLNLNDLYPKACINEVSSLLSKLKDENIQIKENLILEWEKIEKNFFKNVHEFLDLEDQLKKISEIKVVLTPFGTSSSFYSQRKKSNLSPIITCRTDMDAGRIAESILHILYILKTNNGGEIAESKFFKRMEVVRFLMENTILTKFVTKNTKNTNITKEIVTDSKKYLKKLGFPSKKVDLDTVFKKLTDQEEKILKTLVGRRGEIVTFDNIADILWGKENSDKYSLEAMAKTIQNVRNKIKKSGINKDIIFTRRGKGYFLEN